MFEKEASEQALRKYPIPRLCTALEFARNCKYEEGFKDGAEFAYNKVLDWKYLSKGELPDVEGDYFVALKSPNATQSKEVYLLTYTSGYEDEENLGWYDEDGTNFDNEVYAWCKKPEPPKE